MTGRDAATMDDYIKRCDAKIAIDNFKFYIEHGELINDAYEMAVDDLECQPASEVSIAEPEGTDIRKVWEERIIEDSNPLFRRRFYCPFCGNWQTYGKPKYCPDCGERVYE